MAISLRQLEYFVTVIDQGSFTRAAELLLVSQPGLSHQIQALERELGGPLLERLPRKVRLTPPCRTPGPAWPTPSAPAAPPGGRWASRLANCTWAPCTPSAPESSRVPCAPGGATTPNSRFTWSSCATPMT